MLDIHEKERTQVLVAPSPAEGSPMHVMTGFMDEGCPKWNPRPASETEKRSVEALAARVNQFPELLKSLQ